MKSVWKYCIWFCLFIAANLTAQTISQSAFASLNYNNYGHLNLAQTPVQDPIFTTVAVFEFEVEGLSKLEAQVLTDRFTSELEKTQSIQAIVNRENVSEIMDELETEKACKTDSCAIVLGSMLGVDYVVKGTVISEVGWFKLEFELLSVEKKDVVEIENPLQW
jgi:curli biogenesis system outer membrane secretion channel CsgG